MHDRDDAATLAMHRCSARLPLAWTAEKAAPFFRQGPPLRGVCYKAVVEGTTITGFGPNPLNFVMSKALIIAEKPSVANDIARALGGFTKHDEYYESDDYVCFVRGRPPAGDRGARGVRRKARQVELRQSARDSAAFRSEADRQERIAPEGADEADQAQGRRAPDQRLRRGARGRVDLPPDRAAREGQAAGAAPVAAIDDARGRSATASRVCAATQRCSRWPTRHAAAPKPTGSSASTARAR